MFTYLLYCSLFNLILCYLLNISNSLNSNRIQIWSALIDFNFIKDMKLGYFFLEVKFRIHNHFFFLFKTTLGYYFIKQNNKWIKLIQKVQLGTILIGLFVLLMVENLLENGIVYWNSNRSLFFLQWPPFPSPHNRKLFFLLYTAAFFN